MKKKIIRWAIWILSLGIIFVFVSIFSLSVGSTTIPFKKIIFSPFLNTLNQTESSILFELRLPRIILGLAIGGALSLSGVLLQGMFQNPLVEPYTLGISGGAALGVCLNIVFGLKNSFGVLSLPFSGFLGAFVVSLLVYSLSIRRGLLKMQGLLLTGVMLSFICSSLIMFIMAVSRVEDLHGIVFWTLGSLEEPNWSLIKVAVLISILGLLISYLLCVDLNALSLGEEEALHLGINIERSKRLLFVVASLLAGCSVAIGGIIGFVGLVVPHFMRMFVGSDHRILLITSYLSGGCFLIFCDTLARTIIAPLELPIGVITGILGGTLFVYVLSRKQITL